MVNHSVNTAFSSFTTGLKYEFNVVWFGSFGPGIIPVIMIFSGLKRRDRGKFKMTKYTYTIARMVKGLKPVTI